MLSFTIDVDISAYNARVLRVYRPEYVAKARCPFTCTTRAFMLSSLHAPLDLAERTENSDTLSQIIPFLRALRESNVLKRTSATCSVETRYKNVFAKTQMEPTLQEIFDINETKLKIALMQEHSWSLVWTRD